MIGHQQAAPGIAYNDPADFGLTDIVIHQAVLKIHAASTDDAKVGDEGTEEMRDFRPDHVLVFMPILPTRHDNVDIGIH